VVTPTFRYNPAVVAQAMATLGCLYPGRVMLGVGTGESMNEVPVLDIEWPDPPERFARLKEAIELIRRLWTEDFVSFQGEYYRTRNATVYDRPDDPVPLYVAASGPAAARLAGASATASSAPRARASSSTATRSCRPSAKAPTRPAATTTRSRR
jgi:coenzyme F420-dependent glucose-6-phosphate dehydrogenase